MNITRRLPLLILALLLSAATASARARWFQIPAHAVWVNVPQPWKVRADAKAPRLLIQGELGARIEVLAMDGVTMNVAMSRRRTAVESRYKAVKWGRTRLAGEAVATGILNGRKQTVRLRLVPGDGHILVVSAHTYGRDKKAVHVIQDKMVAKTATGWDRPGGTWAQIPKVSARVRIPGNWNAVARNDLVALHLIRKSGEAAFEASLDAREDVDVAGSLERIVEGAGGKVIQWKKRAPWKPKDAKGKPLGFMRRGNATVDGVKIAFVVYAYPVREGHLVVAARASGEHAKKALGEILEIAASLR